MKGYSSFIAAIPSHFGTRDRFCGREFFHGLGVGVESIVSG